MTDSLDLISPLGFLPGVAEKLGYYVYALRDPRPGGGIFYVGKGKGNRVYQHAHEEANVSGESSQSLKLSAIRDIHNSKQEVGVEIIRHNLTELQAFEVETAVIDVLKLIGTLELTYTKLTNKAGGHHSKAYGWMSLDELHERYGAKPLDTANKRLKDDRLVLIKINRLYQPGMSKEELYETTRKWWKLSPSRNPDLALAVYHGIVRAVYRVISWQQDPQSKRWAFVGEVAHDKFGDYVWRDVRSLVGNTTNPIRYYNC